MSSVPARATRSVSLSTVRNYPQVRPRKPASHLDGENDRPAQMPRSHKYIGIRAGAPSNRTRNNSHLAAQSKLVAQQSLHPRLIHHQHNQIGRRRAQLRPETPALNRHSSRSAPSTIHPPARSKSPPILPSKKKRAFDQVRHHHHALRLPGKIVRNIALRRKERPYRHRGMLQPLIRIKLLPRSNPRQYQNPE